MAAIITAAISAAALLWANFRQERFKEQEADLERRLRGHFEQQKAELERQIRALQQAKANQTPSVAEVENKRLQKDVQDLKAQTQESETRAAELKKELDAAQRKIDEIGNRQNSAVLAPDVVEARPSPPNKVNDPPPPRQRLERFIVEVPRAQEYGESATVYVRFTSTVTSRTKMLLADGFLGSNKTFLVDDSGQRYDLDNASGIGNCCFGFAGGDWNGGILDLEPKGIADVTLTFRRRNRAGELERHPKTFTLTAELTVGEVVKRQDWSSPQWQSSGSAGISVPGITPK